jgi:protoporphyrinogen oxidase
MSAGHTPLVLEAGPTPGGLTRSMQVGAFTFDYAGHLLHLARCERPSGLPFAALRDDDWCRIERRSRCLVEGHIVPAPIQYHLGALPKALRGACIDSFEARPEKPRGSIRTFRDFILASFGERLADLFLIPQNEKTLATSLDRLSANAASRFIPPPEPERVRSGMRPDGLPPEEYNSRFWYPKHGGIERLVHGLSEGVEELHLLRRVVEIDLNERSLTTDRGERHSWELMFSSLPLRDLCLLTDEQDLSGTAAALTHSSTVVFNIGVRGTLADALRETHWLYVPDRSLPFYRVGVYSNFSSGLCPPNRAALYAEVAIVPDEESNLSDLQSRVVNELEAQGWIESGSIECIATSVIPCAYVHRSPASESFVPWTLDRLRGHGIVGIGRYGLWDYMSMEDSIHSAIDTVEKAL